MPTFKFTNKSDCGAYFNDARDNFHRTIMDILCRVGFEKKYTEIDLDASLASIIQAMKEGNPEVKKLSSNQIELRQLLFYHFPILGPVMADVIRYRHHKKEQKAWNELKKEEQEQLRKQKKKIIVSDDGERDATCIDCLETLLTFGKCLTDCRNYYTHYSPFNSQEKLEEMYVRQIKVSTWLHSAFNASRQLNKMRKHLSSAEMEFITKHDMIKKTDENGKVMKAENGFDIFVKNHNFFFSIVGESFLSKTESISTSTETTVEQQSATYSQKNYDAAGSESFGNSANNALSDFGLLYLCCCFINRTQAKEFAHKVHLFPDDTADLTYLNWAKGQPWNIVIQQKVTEIRNKYHIENENNLRGIELVNKTIECIQESESPEKTIIQDMLSIYRVRLPKGKRFNKQDNSTTLALDMLNELNRCPAELFNILPSEGQKAFEDIAKIAEGVSTSVSQRVRHSDRFPYLALRAIDEMRMIGNIHFQIRLGYYRFEFYNKECIDGTQQLRRIGKSINGFGRLSAIEAHRISEWGTSDTNEEVQEANKMQRKVYVPTKLEDGETVLDLLQPEKDSEGSVPYVTDCMATYNIHNNRIGLYWTNNTADEISQFPQLRTRTNKNTNNRVRADVEQIAPYCSLSVRDLPALLFLYHLNSGNGYAIKEIIVNKYNKLKLFFEDLVREPGGDITEPTFEKIKQRIATEGLETVLNQDRYKLKVSEIPCRIKDALLPANRKTACESDVLAYFVENWRKTSFIGSGMIKSINDIDKTINKIGESKYYYLASKNNPKNSDTIKHLGLDAIFAELKNKTGKEIPAFVKDFFYPKEPRISKIQEAFSGKLRHRIEEINNQLERMAKVTSNQFTKDNKYAKKSYVDVRYGYLAEKLAESMLKWQPSANGGKNKLTGLNSRRLVDFLATYNSSSVVGDSFGFEALKRILAAAKLIDSNTTSHPFLDEVLNEVPTTIESLYITYLKKEKGKLNSLLDTLKDLNSLKDIQEMAPAFVHPYRERWSIDPQEAAQVRKMAANYIRRGNTIQLPDGLFVEAIQNELQQRYPEILSCASPNEQNNVSYLISRYMEHPDNGDSCQSFYNGDQKRFYRGYEYFKKTLGTQKGNERLYKYMSRDEIFEELKKIQADADESTIREINKIKKNERTILRYKIQDMVLFMTAKKMLQNQLSQPTNNNINVTQINSREKLDNSSARQGQTEQSQNLSVNILTNMMLKDAFDGDALNATIDYEYKLKVSWKLCDEKGREVKVNKETHVPIQYGDDGKLVETGGVPVIISRNVYILQEHVAIKNYGRIFRIIKDPRLELLLRFLIEKREGKNLPETGAEYMVSAAMLANEFAQLEDKRSEAFTYIHNLEKAAYQKLTEEDKESDITFQFKNMMRAICDEGKATQINQYRISFAHNKYGISPDNMEGAPLVPLVSNEMMKQMIKLNNEINNALH
ncbi:MAG: type VI-B CRISPR-associated RNA-guided ribonuclease Cas13b [Bacteroidales bacterium]|nr:type VI-B CRISPR-associated RNA-guided ribonuclease Cas13b [Bacteroidales bacterium]